MLIGRTGAAHNAQMFGPFVGFVVGESGKVGARNVPFLRMFFGLGYIVILRPDAYPAGYFYGCGRCVAGYHFHLYARTATLPHGCRHVSAHGIADACHALIGEILCAEASLAIGKGQRAHGLTLIGKQYFLYLETVGI